MFPNLNEKLYVVSRINVCKSTSIIRSSNLRRNFEWKSSIQWSHTYACTLSSNVLLLHWALQVLIKESAIHVEYPPRCNIAKSREFRLHFRTTNSRKFPLVCWSLNYNLSHIYEKKDITFFSFLFSTTIFRRRWTWKTMVGNNAYCAPRLTGRTTRGLSLSGAIRCTYTHDILSCVHMRVSVHICAFFWSG